MRFNQVNNNEGNVNNVIDTNRVDAIALLESWIAADKARSVVIDRKSGDMTCWIVELLVHGTPVVQAAESPNADRPRPARVARVYACDDRSDWLGLAAVIEVAVRKAEELGHSREVAKHGP